MEVDNIGSVSLVFGLLYYLSSSKDQVAKIKKDHPMIVMATVFLVGYYIIYQVDSTGYFRAVCF